MRRFTSENTNGYTYAELDRANDLYETEVRARHLDPDSATYKSECDAIAEDVMFTIEQEIPNAE